MARESMGRECYEEGAGEDEEGANGLSLGGAGSVTVAHTVSYPLSWVKSVEQDNTDLHQLGLSPGHGNKYPITLWRPPVCKIPHI